jgi:hypothetical protein
LSSGWKDLAPNIVSISFKALCKPVTWELFVNGANYWKCYFFKLKTPFVNLISASSNFLSIAMLNQNGLS